jgi:hypothetical protein
VVRGVADLLLANTRKVDEIATNPLLAELGGASLLPYEYTALFSALHGGAVQLLAVHCLICCS